MRALALIVAMLASGAASATTYDLPECYSKVPTTCSFNEMTLAMCAEEGKKTGAIFLPSQRIHIPGGNKFGSADGELTCVVRRIKDSEPSRYEVTLEK